MSQFCHLHCHTQFSLLDGAAKINRLVNQAKDLGMPALAITDHGNLFGVPHFVAAANKAGIKPIIGCEFYVANDLHDRQDKVRYHQVLLAKNETGYKNLVKLASLGFTEGFYYKPRVDKAHIKQYAEGIIATTCCLGSEVSQTILKKGEAEGERVFLAWLDIFGKDYYIELQRHGIAAQDTCNEVLLRWSKKHNVPVIATNDVHYVAQADSEAQDILLCLQTGKDYDDPKRMRFENNQFFLKSPGEMATAFADVPQALDNTLEIVDKIDTPSLHRDVLMPIFQVPEGFVSQDDYLRHLTYEGAKRVYGTFDDTLRQRIDYELGVIQTMGFSGYFLIVQDFINAAKQLGVVVGPGRGSVAGAVVAYALGITDVDPIRYNLLFERFLNPERVSMPDIDIDFDDEGRQKVIDYVVNKYGRNQVAQIITFGSMAAKSAIRDVSRVLGLPLPEADRIAKMVPEKPGTTLAEAFKEVPELAKLKKDLDSPAGKVLQMATTLEGAARHTGIHAAGVIIAPDDITNYIPVKTDKDSDLLVTQYDGSVVEDVGMLKMDFLGLKTLSIVKDALALVKANHDVDIDITNVPLDDEKTLALYQRGDTVGTFQFESEGMRQWLAKLKPSGIEDLIAMNALYRPGPMQFIPNFIDRKHGREKVDYPHPLLEELLKPTYGIMVYQEQIMQTAQILAGYSLGQADLLRRAMGKKKASEMEKQKAIFVQGAAEKHKISEDKAVEVFEVMAKFAEYGFNRSHSAAYSLVAFQTGYLKAHYPAEYMASVLTHNQHDISKISFFMDECRHQGISVLGPALNESDAQFGVNKAAQVRFGLQAIKGAGGAAVEAIIGERQANGPFKDIFDLAERVSLRKVNKKTFESLAQAGALDAFEHYHRRQYVEPLNNAPSLIEKAIQYGHQLQKEKNSAQQSLFGGGSTVSAKPRVEDCAPYDELEKLRIEKEMVGFYISGHPLDAFKPELQCFCTAHTANVLEKKGQTVHLGGMLTGCSVRQSKSGRPFGRFTLEDYMGTLDLVLFGEDLRKNQHLLHDGDFVYLTGTVQERYNQPDVWELRVGQIQPLHDMRARLTRALQLTVAAELLTTDTVSALTALVAENPGKVPLEVTVQGPGPEAVMAMSKARAYQIDPNNELLQEVNSLLGIACVLAT